MLEMKYGNIVQLLNTLNDISMYISTTSDGLYKGKEPNFHFSVLT